VQPSSQRRIWLEGRLVEYKLVESKIARKIRVRVGPHGIDVVQPLTRSTNEVSDFLAGNSRWILDQIDRAERLSGIRRALARPGGEILFRGERTRVRVDRVQSRAAGNSVRFVDGQIVVSRGPRSRTPAVRSLERWLREEARRQIESDLAAVEPRLGRQPERVFVMGQRTKWGNCSSRRNLSFNWRLILAPPFVLRYLVTHEAVHLVVPDHSPRFWLTVRSLCDETDRARHWLRAHQEELQIDLSTIVSAARREGEVADLAAASER